MSKRPVPYEDQLVELRCPACRRVQKRTRDYLALMCAHQQVAGAPPGFTHKCPTCKHTTEWTFPDCTPEGLALIDEKIALIGGVPRES